MNVAGLGFRSLRARLLWGTLLVIVFVMAGAMAVVDHRQRAGIIEEVQRRGELLARNLAAVSYGPLLLYNFTALEQNVARVAAEDDVVYAIILDADGKVAAHSRRPDRVGLPLHGEVAERAADADAALTQETTRHGERIYDFTLPIYVGAQKWGTVRVGVSQRRMEAGIRRTRWELGVLTLAMLAFGAVAAALVARRIAGPVQRLSDAAAAISRGDLTQRIAPTTADELGRLAVTFNHMAAQLFQQRTELESTHGELRERFVELADLKSYTDSILTSVTSGIVTVDLEGRVVTLNPAAELMTGFFAGEAAGRYCTEVFTQSAELGDILMETLTTRSAITAVPMILARRNGARLPVELSAAPLKGSDGKDLGAVGVFRDLTLVRELESQLRRSDRLAAVGSLAAGLAHEIKNPLTSLLTFSRHLPRRFEDEQFRQKFLNVVPRELERINTIVERLLELARPPRLHFGLLRLPALLDRVVDLYANQIEAKRVTVVREYARDVPPVHADQDALYRAFVNLAANALEAMPGRGRLTLRVAWSDAGEAVPGRARLGARRVKIEIEDTGSGIPPAESDRIFNPFFTTKEGGTGLGLALTHKIVEEHGGTITFRDAPGTGTVFRVVLPLMPDTGAGTTDDADRS